MSIELIEVGKFLLGLITISGILSVMGLLAAYYAFPPNLTIEEVKNKNKYNIESSLIVKNIGKLPAHNIIVDCNNLHYVNDLGGRVSNITFSNCGPPISKLSSGESTEISVAHNIRILEGMTPGRSLKSCSYNLILRYEFKLPILKLFKKTKLWYIELRNFENDFIWQINLK